MSDYIHSIYRDITPDYRKIHQQGVKAFKRLRKRYLQPKPIKGATNE